MDQFSLEKQSFINDQVLRIMRFSECLTWFVLHDKISNRLIEKYLEENDIDSHETKTLFDRYKMSNQILSHQEQIFDRGSVEQMLNLCPNETWRTSIKNEFDLYDPSIASKCNLDKLHKLRLFSFHGFKLSGGFKRFQGDIYSQKIRVLLGNMYDEIDGLLNLSRSQH